jgi:uncharacterized damage-inducible protein DinB
MINKVEPPPEPAVTLSDPRELLTGYLDFYREAALRKLDGLSADELRNSRLPSGWSPLSLLKHLAYVELRWMRWGFAGEQIAEPWGDHSSQPGQWNLEPGETIDDVKAFFQEQCDRTRAIVAEAPLEGQAATLGGRVPADEDRPTLIWILFHLLQEYARHVGHLDIARELADGVIGE